MGRKADPLARESRQRILAAARAEFAEKGFDGARVDEIAVRAQVNKALIYYYFKNKDALLQELMTLFLEERKVNVERIVASGTSLPDNMMVSDTDFLYHNRDLLGIALTEELKAANLPEEGHGHLILENWLASLDTMRGYYASQGFRFRITPRVLVALCFYHLLPAVTHAALGEPLAKLTGLDQGRIRSEFLRISQEITDLHSKTVFAQSNQDSAAEVALPLQSPPKREQAASPATHVLVSMEEKNSILAKYMVDGCLLRFPRREKEKVAILEHLSSLFEPRRNYSEKQVNTLLGSLTPDYVKIRRYLVDYGYLARYADGSRYWSQG